MHSGEKFVTKHAKESVNQEYGNQESGIKVSENYESDIKKSVN